MIMHDELVDVSEEVVSAWRAAECRKGKWVGLARVRMANHAYKTMADRLRRERKISLVAWVRVTGLCRLLDWCLIKMIKMGELSESLSRSETSSS